MGITVTASARLSRGGLMRAFAPALPPERMVDAVSSWPIAVDLGPLMTFQSRPGAVTVEILPVAPCVTFRWTKTELTAEFESQTAGPGYHAAVVGLLAHLQDTLAISWSILDPTEYAASGDFHALQLRHAEFVRASFAQVAQRGFVQATFCLPEEFRVAEGEIGLPLGIVPNRNLADLVGASSENLTRLGQLFFPWWNEGLSPGTWQRLLRALMWQIAPWRPSSDPQDRRCFDQIEWAAAQSRVEGSTLSADLESALKELSEVTEGKGRALPKGIGYRKRDCAFKVFQHWEIQAPGYARLEQDVTSDKRTMLLTCPWFQIRLTSMTIVVKPGGMVEPSWPEAYEPMDLSLRDGSIWRKTSVETLADGSRAQTALVWRRESQKWELLILTLLSSADFAFERFPSWVDSLRDPGATVKQTF